MEDIKKEEKREEDRAEKVESLKVKTDVKAGGDPETPPFADIKPPTVS